MSIYLSLFLYRNLFVIVNNVTQTIFFKCCFETFSFNSKTSFRIQNGTRHFENVSTNGWNGSTTTHPQLSSERPQLDNTPINDDDDALFVPIVLGISFLLCILSLLLFYYIKRSKIIFLVSNCKNIDYRKLKKLLP